MVADTGETDVLRKAILVVGGSMARIDGNSAATVGNFGARRVQRRLAPKNQLRRSELEFDIKVGQ